MKHLSKLLFVTAISATMLLQGCTDGEIAVGTGAVIGGVIGGIISNDGYDRGRDRRCQGSYRTQCNNYRDYYGRVYRECRQVYDRCSRYYAVENDQAIQANMVSEDATVLASKYQLSFAASEKINYAAQQLAAGNLAVVDGMDLVNMTPDSLAKDLNVQTASVEKLYSDVKTKTMAQLSDFNSEYWTLCRASGKWATPENMSCKEASWNGCSPATGATLCKAR